MIIKKFGLACSALLLTVCLHANETPFWEQLSLSLKMAYDFNNVSLDKVLDISGGQKDGKFLNSQDKMPFAQGHEGFGFSSSDINPTLIIDESADFKNDFSISLWIKPIKFGERVKIISKRKNDFQKGFITIGEDKGKIYAGIGDGNNYVLTPKDTKLEPGIWQHVCVTMDQNVQSLSLYLNGKKISEVSCRLRPKTKNAKWSIGSDLEGTDGHFEGVIDDVYILDKALSESMVKALYLYHKKQETNQKKSKILRQNWIEIYDDFNEITPKISKSYDNSFFGPILGDTFYRGKGKKLGALYLNSNYDHFKINKEITSFFEKSFAVSYWLNTKNTKEEDETILNLMSNRNKKPLMQWKMEKDGLTVRCGNGRKYQEIKNNIPLRINEWTHVLTTYNRETTNVEIFIDGRLSVTKKIDAWPDISLDSVIVGSESKLTGKAIDGGIDELKIYQAEFSLEEIQSEYKLATPLDQSFTIWADQSPELINSLIAYYTFENDLSGKIYDHSKVGHHASTDPKKNISTVKGYSGRSLLIDKTKNTFGIKTPLSHYFDEMTDFTVSMWLSPKNLTNSIQQPIFTRYSKEGFLISLEVNNSRLELKMKNENLNQKYTATTPLPKQEWQHVVLSFSGTQKSLSLYQNGLKVLESKIEQDIPILNKSYFSFGYNQSKPTETFTGRIDEIKLFNKYYATKDITRLSQVQIGQSINFKPINKTKISAKKNRKKSPVIEKGKKENSTQKKNLIRSNDVRTTKSKKAYMKSYGMIKDPLPKHRRIPNNIQKVPAYRKLGLNTFITFEGKNISEYKDELSSPITIKYNGDSNQIAYQGFHNLGCYLSSSSSLSLEPIRLKIPKTFSIEFEIHPFELNYKYSLSLLTIKNQSSDQKFLQVVVKNDELFLKLGDNEPQDLNLKLYSLTWTNLILVFDTSSQKISLFKNKKQIRSFSTNISLPSKVELILGNHSNTNGIEMVIDDLKLYQKALESPSDLPSHPRNPAIVLLNDKSKSTFDSIEAILQCENAHESMVSHEIDFVGAKWQPYKSRTNFQAKATTGKHMVYCKFRTKEKVESYPVVASYNQTKQSKEINFIYPKPNKQIPGKR